MLKIIDDMHIIEFFKKLLEGRGFYAAFMVISSWMYFVVLLGVLICQVFLYIFRIKYYNSEFDKEIHKKRR